MFRRAILLQALLILLSVFCSQAFADVLYLKNGKKIAGKIIEKTDKYVKIEYEKVLLTYWSDEVDKIGVGEELPEPEPMDLKKATTYLYDGKWQEAIEGLKNIVTAQPQAAGAYFNLGCAYALTGEYDKAIEKFEEAQLLEPVPFDAFCYFNIAGVYTKKAIVHRDQKMFGLAAENFKKASKVMPNFILAVDYARYSEVFASLVELPQKIGFAASELGVPPDSGVFLNENKMKGSGERKHYLFDENTPPLLYFYHSPNCWWLVALSGLDLRDPEKLPEETQVCLKNLLHLLENEYNNRINQLVKRNVLVMLSNFYREKEDWDNSIAYAQKAVDAGFNYSQEYINLGFSSFQKGEYLQADQLVKKALDINPDSEAKNLLEEIQRKAEAKIITLNKQ